MNPDIIIALAVPSMFCWFAWLIFSTIRRYKIAKLQAELQSRLLEKIGSGQELVAYAQTETGRQLLESLKVERVAPHGRIIGALQAGIVLVVFGSGMLAVRSHVPDPQGSQGFAILGTLIVALGLGFALSSVASYYLSKSFGLLNGASQ
jgi:FtsH-binding integral membrane protein